MEHQGPTTWLLKLPLLPHSEEYLVFNGSIIVFLAILVFSLIANAAIRKNGNALLIPSRKFSIATVADLLVEGLYNLVTGVLGHHGEEHFSLIAALFIFVWFSNLFGLIPLSSPPTNSVDTTFALGITSFLYYNISGIRSHGLANYGKHFLMGLGIFGLPIAFFELISHVIRPVTLGLRLMINMHIDHELARSFGEIFAWLLPVPLLLFGVLVCTIQAFLFAILTTVYVQMATEHEEH